MHRQALRATITATDRDLPIGVFTSGNSVMAYDSASQTFKGVPGLPLASGGAVNDDIAIFNGTTWIARQRTLLTQSSDQAGVGTTLTAISSLIFPIKAGQTYVFDISGLYQPSAAVANNGPQFDMTLTGGASLISFLGCLDIAATTGTFTTAAAGTPVNMTSAPAAAINLPWRFYGNFTVNAAGFINPRIATVSAGTLTSRAGAIGSLSQK